MVAGRALRSKPLRILSKLAGRFGNVYIWDKILQAHPKSPELNMYLAQIRKLLIRLAIKTWGRHRPRCGPVLFLTPSICVKYGKLVDLSEASTIRFVSQHTAIPVPKIYYAFQRKGCTYIVMEKLQGDVLGNVWATLSNESKAKILSHLRLLIDDMRQLRPKTSHISNVDGGPLRDGRLPGLDFSFGPFDSQKEFHESLRGGIMTVPEEHLEVAQLIDMHRLEWPLCFTHGDLSSFNIIVQDDQVTGIIDWGQSGWYPAYWEYTMASSVNPHNSFWKAQVDQFLDPFPRELGMEMVRQQYFGDI